MRTIRIRLNGQNHTVREGLTVLELLESLNLKPERVAVELDRQILRRPEFPSRKLEPDSQVEIVHFVGGG